MNRSRITFLIGLCIAAGLFVLTVNIARGNNSEVKSDFQPVVSWEGSYSSIEQVEYHRVMNEKQLASLWAAHKGKQLERDSYDQPVVPFVDFDKYMVLAIFRGNAWNTRAQMILAYAQQDDIIEVHFDSRTYQTNGPVEDKDYTRAYGIWVLPRSNKQMALIENVQGLLNKPPKWKTQHTFKAIVKN